MPELKTRMGWVNCPKDNWRCDTHLHCYLTPDKPRCPHYRGHGENKLHCTYGEEVEEEDKVKTPVATYGLCEGIERGSKFKVRKEDYPEHEFFEEREEVEITDFWDESRLPQCRNEKARLLKFKGSEKGQWHPSWIINCRKCPFYDPTWHWDVRRLRRLNDPGEDPDGLITKGNAFWFEDNDEGV